MKGKSGKYKCMVPSKGKLFILVAIFGKIQSGGASGVMIVKYCIPDINWPTFQPLKGTIAPILRLRAVEFLGPVQATNTTTSKR